MSNLVIRESEESDLEPVYALWVEMHEFHAKRDSHYSLKDQVFDIWKDWFRGFLGEDDKTCFVATEGSVVVGFIILKVEKSAPVLRQEEYGLIDAVAVNQAFRGKGIGKELYQAALAWFKERKITRMEANVATSNEVSMGFWHALGYKTYQCTMYHQND